jgi:hypothetical protein
VLALHCYVIHFWSTYLLYLDQHIFTSLQQRLHFYRIQLGAVFTSNEKLVHTTISPKFSSSFHAAVMLQVIRNILASPRAVNHPRNLSYDLILKWLWCFLWLCL